jgi:hypothetical protein
MIHRIFGNPDFHERGYRRLISALEVNATVTTIQMTTDDVKRQVKESQVKLKELCDANHALRAVKNVCLYRENSADVVW